VIVIRVIGTLVSIACYVMAAAFIATKDTYMLIGGVVLAVITTIELRLIYRTTQPVRRPRD
jgi:hypothetical protein